uniref:Mediator of RNA polymerase II transcription subunit 7 n=1 Tax=Strongyloides venezuelensis TaxID=75913 RepID=A0A0K0FBF6_STRVS
MRHDIAKVRFHRDLNSGRRIQSPDLDKFNSPVNVFLKSSLIYTSLTSLNLYHSPKSLQPSLINGLQLVLRCYGTWFHGNFMVYFVLKMSRNLYYQSCMRILKDNKNFLSSEGTYSNTVRKKFYESSSEGSLYELHNFTLRKVLIEKNPNALTEISNFLSMLYKTRPRHNCISLDQQFTDEEVDNELSLDELLGKKDKPTYYKITEEEKLLNLSEINFKKWFRKEISSILNVIEHYKIDGNDYDFPANYSFVVNCTVITDTQDRNELQRELYFLYNRVASIYSVIATDVIKSTNGRKGLFKELNFLKILLEIITYQMDIHDVKIEQYIDSLIKTYPKATFGARTSLGLCNILSIPEIKLKDLGNMVASILANLAPSLHCTEIKIF